MQELRDALLKGTKTLPNGSASAATLLVGLETGRRTAAGEAPGDIEWLLSAPALAVGVLANGATMTYDIIVSNSSDLSAPTTLIAGAIVQTGAGGVGAAAATSRFRLPDNTGYYVGFKATNSSTGNASTSSGTLEALL